LDCRFGFSLITPRVPSSRLFEAWLIEPFARFDAMRSHPSPKMLFCCAYLDKKPGVASTGPCFMATFSVRPPSCSAGPGPFQDPAGGLSSAGLFAKRNPRPFKITCAHNFRRFAVLPSLFMARKTTGRIFASPHSWHPLLLSVLPEDRPFVKFRTRFFFESGRLPRLP